MNNKIFYIFLIVPFLISSCALKQEGSSTSDLRALGNKETIRYTKTSCDNPNVIMKHGACVEVTDIVSLKVDGQYKEERNPDGTVKSIEVNNSGRPGFFESVSDMFKSITMKEIIDDD